ncbi:type 1 glutamine amidotransferase domain-containing protein [Aquimarina sp. ERC-38]|uniref:type 1 glutamine amidotransferase domain-containing protein n=1 Tax=Aquimarina sp. ERC-38 TaxID=2949996 RepID=UPI0022477E38|nr:type 1 glutamine amidotransferase domain-containing protein [Aquimarina sp. ERC-38]UZO79289.1 type 1 glutamine amidotransferase domain-containing protein [Aquimarina sp. ERC-38]
MKNILIITTSHSELLNTDTTTGLWLGEFTEPYYYFIDKGYTITIANPKGGYPPIDPVSELTENITSSNRRFQEDPEVKQRLQNAITLDEVDVSKFDGVFFPGGHGPMFDLANNQTSASIINQMLVQGKPVASVCHGPAALIKAAEENPALLVNKKVTGFSNAEEKLVLKDDTIPFFLEDALKEKGGNYTSAALPFTTHVEVDGLLITGQNPMSSSKVAEELDTILIEQTVIV